MAGQDVQNDACGMDVVRQGLGTGSFDGLQTIDEHGAKDIDHLPITARLSFELALNPAKGRRQIPVLERCPVAQCAGFAGQNRDVVKRIVDRLAAAEDAIMPSHDLSVLPAFQAIGVGADLNGTTDRASIDRVPVLVEPYEASLGDGGRDGMEAVKRSDIGDQTSALFLEHVPDCLVRDVGMPVRLGISDAPVLEPGVQLRIGSELRPWYEEPPSEHAHLVLDLALLPTRCRGASNRIDQVMPAHLLKTADVGAILANEDRIHHRLHVVVDTPGAGAAEEGERLVMRIEHHLLGLSGISPHKRHPAVAETDMGDLDRRGHAVEDHDLMAPVELVGLARIEAQRDIGAGRRFLRRLRPTGRISAHGVIAAVIAAAAQLLVDPDQRQAFAFRSPGIVGQHLVQLGTPGIDLRTGLPRAVIGELGRPRSDDLAHRVPRQTQLAADLLDRFAFDEMRSSDLRDRLHNQHPLTAPSHF